MFFVSKYQCLFSLISPIQTTFFCTLMVYYFFLVLTSFLQVFAAVVALKLMRITKYNVSWLLISLGLVIMSVRSVINIVRVFVPDFGPSTNVLFEWGGILVSLCFAIGVYMIRHIFIYNRMASVKERSYEKRMLRTVVQTEEHERQRFAAELHDGLGPQLSLIKMNFSAVASDIKDEEVRRNLERSIAEAIATVREVSNNLSPHILSNFGLAKAIDNFIYKVNKPDEMVVKSDMQIADKRYQSTKEIVIYRVFCELFNNTLKHAQATEIAFSIYENKGDLVLDYTDNGIGFNPEELDVRKFGMGYYNIMSRVTSLKGTVQFCDERNVDKTGLQVTIKLPIDERRNEDMAGR